jgi:hypothetical protein
MLLAHLAGRMTSKTENLATEALGYILGKSAVAGAALAGHLTGAGMTLPDNLSFLTQVHGDGGAIPDLVGTDASGCEVLMIEVKYWAGLTANQPVTYLKRLPDHTGAALLMVAPATRFETLWSELQRRCAAASMPLVPVPCQSTEMRAARVNGTHLLILTSWRAVLDRMSAALKAAGDLDSAADVAQLQGLCAQMDSDAFLPLTSQELSIATPRRVRQFMELLDDLTRRVIEEKLASPVGKNLRLGSTLEYWGYYLVIGKVGVGLFVDLRRWDQLRATPFWLEIHGLVNSPQDWGPPRTSTIKPLLASLEAEQPPRLLMERGNQKGKLVIPVFPLTGQERDRVLDDLIRQVREVAALLASA